MQRELQFTCNSGHFYIQFFEILKHFNGDISYQYALSPFFYVHYIVECYHHQLAPFSGSPVVTSLRYDNESRTFTCTSTGGPATTLTWRRDGVVITLNAIYQQTKRVGSSVSQSDTVGTYNWTVENARGTSSRMTTVSKLTLHTCHCYLYGMVAIDRKTSYFFINNFYNI